MNGARDSFQGRTVLVTAAGSGMAKEASLRLGERGATVIVSDRDLDAARRTAAAVTDLGGSAHPIELDVADATHWARLVDDCAATTELDGVFHNAGITGPPGIDVDLEAFRTLIRVNVQSAQYMLEHLRAALASRQAASIVVTASSAALVASPAGYAAYAMSKGALVAWARTAAVALAEESVRVNVLSPGPTWTPTLYGALGADSADSSALQDYVGRSVPMGRPGQPWELAEAALFLLDHANAAMTGTVLTVDGGMTAA